ncbi:hypothetical protein [Microbispora bryophytorum]|uniref:hypothetical protein n=1 Tax=Microbispora bryophytorum TaxID=1460882 RepID=UPI003711ADA2
MRFRSVALYLPTHSRRACLAWAMVGPISAAGGVGAALDVGRGDATGLGASARWATLSMTTPQPDRLTTRTPISHVPRTGDIPQDRP